MKQHFLALLLVLCLGLMACGSPAVPATHPESTVPETSVPESTIPPTETAAPPTVETVPPTTENPHSAFYLEGVSVEDVILYYNEVCLDAEFVYGGNPNLLQKWAEPITYILYGTPTQEDLTVLRGFADWLNAMEGFPGIQETADPTLANLRIHFCSEQELTELMGPDYAYMDGAVTFWYLENAIYDAIICCRSDLDQQLRNSVILEELYNGLGPVQDTWLREDSIIFAGYSEPQSLTPMDQLLLRMLYHPQMQCGMDAAACEAVIRDLYY